MAAQNLDCFLISVVDDATAEGSTVAFYFRCVGSSFGRSGSNVSGLGRDYGNPAKKLPPAALFAFRIAPVKTLPAQRC